MSHSPLLLLYKDCRTCENSVEYVRRHYCILWLMRKLMEAKRSTGKKMYFTHIFWIFGGCEGGFKTCRSFRWYNINHLIIPSECNIALFATGNHWNFICIIALGISEMEMSVQDLKRFSKTFKPRRTWIKANFLLSSRYKRKITHKKNFKLHIHSCNGKLYDYKDSNHNTNSVFASKVWSCSACVMVGDLNGENVVVAI